MEMPLTSREHSTSWIFAILAAVAFLAGFPSDTRAAIMSPDQGRLSLQELEEFRARGIPDEQWPALLETLGHSDQRAAVLTLVKEQQPFPAAKLVALLTHAKLAVRLGALDLLEDIAGDTFGFDPWQENPAAGANADALVRWKAWSERGPGAAAATAATLNEETFRAIALEIMSGNRERAERGMQRLDGFGLAAIAHLEAFFQNQPELEPAPRAALKTAEYRVALGQALPKQAAGLARDLALGRPELQSTALATAAKGGPGVLPVIADFLIAPDPLVRESAADGAFEAGKAHAVGIAVERLRDEKAESVLHALLRGVGQYASDQAQNDAIARLTEHPAENVVISALEALRGNQVGDVSAVLAARLADPRWRVRAAALETIGKRNLKDLVPKIAERLQDSDLFVRVSAVDALKKVADNEANGLLVEQFARQDDLKAPILQALFSNPDKPPPEAVWAALEKAPPEIILQCLDTLEDRSDYQGKRVPSAARFAAHPNRDVSASALRLLAGRGRHTALLLDALKSADPVRQDAVLDELRLLPGFLAGPSGAAVGANAATKSAPNPLLSRLYDALVGSARKPAGGAAAAGAGRAEAHAPPADMRAVLERFLREGSPRQRFRAAVVLAGQGDAAATGLLLAQFDTLSSLDRRSIAGALNGLTDWSAPTQELAIRLLRDPADDVREQAIEVWLDVKRPALLAALLAEFSRPGSRLNADDIYGWELDRLTQDASTHPTIREWGRAVLADAAAPEPHKVLAVVLLGRSGQAQQAPIEPLLDAPGPWLRRAAYRALGLAAAQKRVDALLRDESALVRAALPFLASPHNSGWRHWFDDAHRVHDSEDFDHNSSSGRAFGAWAQHSSAKGEATPEVVAGLEKLARDPSDLVRFEAQFALLRLGRPVDPAALGALVAAQDEDSYARTRLGNFLENNFPRLGKGYAGLVPLAKDISDSNRPKLLRHFGIENERAFTSFAALSQLAPTTARVADLAIDPARAAVPRAAPFRVIFFYKPGCRDCDRVRDMLNRHAPEFPTMVLEERNIDDTREAVLNEALSARFRLKDTLHQVTPAVFTQAGPLVREEITFPRLGDLLRKTGVLTPEAGWAQVAGNETAAARQTIATRYEALSFWVVAAAGLLDGINPCAFATIIFLLSYLQIARRTPREILAVGAAFIGAVFLSYFLVGLGLTQVLAKIAGLRVAGLILNYVLAAFALVVAVLSFRDAQLAARGEFGEMTLQLPGMLKEQIRGVIRTGARASRFVAAAFAAGVVISLLELACTGQVYLPTILYMLRSGSTGAVGHLVLYNAAFITPLIIIFLLAWTGLRSEALIRFQKERTALVKVLTGLLFLLLTAFLLFGHALVPQLAASR
jgi:cytochrome c biogenesis protein CcdA/HEAT repeat protein/glutaredoxin